LLHWSGIHFSEVKTPLSPNFVRFQLLGNGFKFETTEAPEALMLPGFLLDFPGIE